jgi:D-alanine-D-alanine ligase
MLDAFRTIGAYVELFEGEQPLLQALVEGRLQRIDRPVKVIYNGVEGGVTRGGFKPGRNAVIPAIADAYGLICANSDAYGCALARHKFHYFTLLRTLDVPTPPVWHYRPSIGWVGGQAPPEGEKVIAKSTYESWSVGVTEDSIFTMDDSCEQRVAAIAEQIGQPVTVQAFVRGQEVCVPVLAHPGRVVTPAMEALMAKAVSDADAVMTIDDNLRDDAVTHRRLEAPPEFEARLASIALKAFDLLQLEAFARVDFRVDEGGTPWVTDVNASPGLSVNSSAFKSLNELGFSHASFLRIVIGATLGSRGILSSPARTRAPAS